MLILREQKYCMYLQIYAQIPERRPKLTWILAVLPFRLMEPIVSIAHVFLLHMPIYVIILKFSRKYVVK